MHIYIYNENIVKKEKHTFCSYQPKNTQNTYTFICTYICIPSKPKLENMHTKNFTSFEKKNKPSKLIKSIKMYSDIHINWTSSSLSKPRYVSHIYELIQYSIKSSNPLRQTRYSWITNSKMFQIINYCIYTGIFAITKKL